MEEARGGVDITKPSQTVYYKRIKRNKLMLVYRKRSSKYVMRALAAAYKAE